MIGDDVRESFGLSVGPSDFDSVGTIVRTEAEVEAKIALGDVAAAAEDFARLRQVAGGDANAGVEGEAVGCGSGKFEAEPMICGTAFDCAGSWDRRRGFR